MTVAGATRIRRRFDAPDPAAAANPQLGALIAVVAVVLLWLLAPVLTPFVIGAVLAYALHPAVEQLAARRVPRLLAVVLVEIAALVALAALLLLIVPILSKELPLLREQLPVLAERINRIVTPWLAQMGIHVSLDTGQPTAFVLKYLDANWDAGLAAALSSARIGGSIVARASSATSSWCRWSCSTC